MKIVVLNECFLDEEHMRRLKDLGDVEVFPNTENEQDAINRLKGADIAIVDGFLCPLNKAVLESTSNLRLLVLPHTGYHMVDLEVANRKGVKVVNSPGFSKQAVAEMVIGLMFAVNRKIVLGDKLMRENPYELDPGKREDDKYWGFDLKDKTMGVIGLGNIGSVVAQLALGLGMKVIATNRSPRNMDGVEMVSLDELLKGSDVVSVNVTSSAENENIISERELSLMKQNAILINVDQAKQVDTEAVYHALKENKIGGAGLDCVAGLEKGHPLLELDNVVLTPHAGSYTDESFRKILPEIVTSNVGAFINGSPKNIVN